MEKELLAFATAGSVDDGKSTLIGRLLYDTKALFDDQLIHAEKASRRKGLSFTDLALITDGLKAEREQGITIDVAYRYFSTPKRKFIIADTPGHIQYTRNMVTGASTVNLALILIDARNGVVEQTRRHALISSLLKVPHLLVCINKMDLVDWKEKVYEKIVQEFNEFSARLEISDIQYVPICALEGDNVVEPSSRLSWYKGSTLLWILENLHISSDYNLIDCRFPVQYVIRPQTQENHDYRGYAGRIGSGVFKPGDKVVALPAGFSSTITAIDSYKTQLKEAFPPLSVVIRLEDDLDISRGDMLVRPNNLPEIGQDLDLMICWFSTKPLVSRGKYWLKHTTKQVKCIVKEVLYKININTLHRIEDNLTIQMNDIARIRIRTSQPVFWDPYSRSKTTGSVIFIDEASNETLAAGMLL
ncbi:MAG: GTP-binding protein [Candidatus Eremiobacteraeota bacterium]|nr:GTP-binding protein [Candidatus Eremiobacteraeota bacterium]